MVAARWSYLPLGSSPLLQPRAKSERRTTKLERAGEVDAHHIHRFAKALGLDRFKIGLDHRLWWADPSTKPTMGDRKVLLYLLASYDIQASDPEPSNARHIEIILITIMFITNYH